MGNLLSNKSGNAKHTIHNKYRYFTIPELKAVHAEHTPQALKNAIVDEYLGVFPIKFHEITAAQLGCCGSQAINMLENCFHCNGLVVMRRLYNSANIFDEIFKKLDLTFPESDCDVASFVNNDLPHELAQVMIWIGVNVLSGKVSFQPHIPQEFRDIAKRGEFYCPAYLHYNIPGVNVTCDYCKKNGLDQSYGFDDKNLDLCVECRDQIKQITD